MWKAIGVLGTGRTAAVAVAVMLLASCGTSNTKSIPGGIATGAGFYVKLPTGWRSFDQATQNKIAAESSQQLRATGVAVGEALEAGHWINPASKGDDSLVVDVEPVTADTSDATLSQEQNALLQRVGATGVRELSAAVTVDGVAATGSEYSLNGFDVRLISARRGTYLYSITVGAKPGQGTNVDRLLETVVKAWRWTTTAVPELAQLERFSGHGYKVTLPAGWKGQGSSGAALAGLNGADSLWSGYVGSGGQSAAAVWVRPAAGAALDQLVAEELKNGGKRVGDERLGGAVAAVLDISSHGVHLHEWVALHGGREYAIVVRTTEARRALDDATVRNALDSWQFTS
jgi:hypothetical protein